MKKIEKVAAFAVVLLLLGMVTGYAQEAEYEEIWTSGPFIIAPETVSVDWAILNNSGDIQSVRVTVYQYPVLGVRDTVETGTYVILDGQATHNANCVDGANCPYTSGYYTEVVVEANNPNMHPMVVQWSGSPEPGGPNFIPGTLIPSGDFVEIKKPKNK